MRQATIWRWSTAVVVLASAIACGDDDGAGPTPTIQLTAAPTTLPIQQGASGTVTLTLVRGGGFSGPVTATVTGLPAGVTVSVAPATLSGTTTTATVTVDVGAAVAPGVYTATVTGAASGVASATTTFTVTVTAAPNVALAVTPAAITVPQGTSGNATVNITRTNFTGAVALSLDAPPAGVTGTFNPASTTTNTSTLTVAVAGTVAAGNYTLTIKGTATGVGDRTTTLALTVTAPPGTIAIALTPQAASVAQGSSGQATVTITRTNWPDLLGLVTLVASGAPAGITIGFSQSPTTASQVQLTYAAALTAPLGTHSITVTASGTGVANATATFALTVTQAPPAGQVEYQFCSSSENPVFFAYQDGTGAWQRVTGTLSGSVYRYTFSLTQGRGGVFYVQQSGTSTTSAGTLGALTRAPLLDRVVADATARMGLAVVTTAQPYETTVFYATTAELTTDGVESCAATASTKSVFVSFAGVGGGQTATLSLGGSTEFVIGGVTPSPVEFTDVATGTIDFFGSRESATTGVPDKFFDMRNLNPVDGSTLPFVVDFNSANAYAPASALLTIGNALGDELVSFATFITSNGEAGLLGGSAAPSTAVTRTWYGVPSAKLQTGDVHASILFASPATTTTDEIRLHFSFTTTVQNLTPVLGSRLPTPTVASVGQPAYPRLRVQGTLPAEYNDLVFVNFGPSGGGNEISVMATGAYIVATTGGATYDLSIPDLTALAGFPLVSALPAGEIEATVNANGWTGIGTTEPVPVNGGVFQGAAKTVKITP